MTTTTFTPYEQLFQSFGLSENPFRSSPDMRFLFLGRCYETALAEMMFGIESKCGLLILTGEPGTGKTLLLRRFLQWLGQRKSSSAFVFHSNVNTAGLFALIAKDFGISFDSTRKSDVLAAIQKWLQARQSEGDSPVIIIDEAQALSLRALSELCLLLNLENSNGKLVQVLLAGQTELDEKLRQPELRQLRQRIGARCRLPALSLEETEEYVTSRIRSAGGRNEQIFSTEAVQVLYPHAQGIPRVINLLCEKSLLAAYADRQTKVSPANVKRAACELDFGYESAATQTSESSFRLSFVAPLESVLAKPERELPEQPATTPSSTPAAPPVQPSSSVPAEPRPKPNVRFVAPLESFLAQPEPEPPEQPATMPSSTPAEQPPPVQPLSSVPAEPRPKPNVRVLTPKPAMPEPPADERARASAPTRVAPSRQRLQQSAFRRYWTEVAQSFVRDCKYFFSAFRTQSAGDGKVLFMKKYDLHRDLVAPVSRWLNKPVTLKGHRSTDSDRRAGGQH